MKCKYCNEKDAVKYSNHSNGEFCSKECARGFSTKAKRKEINEKVSKTLTGRKSSLPKFRTYYSHICEICKVEFETTKRIQKTCGDMKCKNKLISKKQKENGAGGYRKGSGRCIGEWYISPIAGRVYLDSSYEVRLAKVLDKRKIKWKRNTKRFPYLFENKEHYYIPDFYLVGINKYVETKGYGTEQDKSKWLGFPYKLKIVYKEDLEKIENGAIV